MKKISVVIPTYNRAENLKMSLTALLEQDFSIDDYEIIVINDGSTYSIDTTIAGLSNNTSSIRIYNQEHRGPGPARNLGIKESTGEIILFVGDDIVSSRRLLREHFEWHQKFKEENIAVLGFVSWSSDIKITPFMKWIESNGLQFAYPLIKNCGDLGFKFFYTANISVKRRFFLKNNLFFDEQFKHAAFEDTELGYRFCKIGGKIVYNKNAIGYHYHPITFSSFCLRTKYAIRSAILFSQKWPGVISLPQVENRTKFNYLKSLLKKVFYPIIRKFIDFIDMIDISPCIGLYQRLLDYYSVNELKKCCQLKNE